MQVVNIVTCESEVGSGTFHAAGGRYFSSVVPISDSSIASPSCGEPVEGLSDGVETVAIPARAEQGIVDSSDPVQDIVDRCAKEGSVPIVHCVVGCDLLSLSSAVSHRLDGAAGQRRASTSLTPPRGSERWWRRATPLSSSTPARAAFAPRSSPVPAVSARHCAPGRDRVFEIWVFAGMTVRLCQLTNSGGSSYPSADV